jgi:hypothetical protein
MVKKILMAMFLTSAVAFAPVAASAHDTGRPTTTTITTTTKDDLSHDR